MAIKPLWRDEFWSLFFSDPTWPLKPLIAQRMRIEVHPPLYYMLLYGLRRIGAGVLALRGVQFAALLAGLAILVRTRRSSAETTLYVLALIGSYWGIYYAVELRPYLLDLLFVVGSMATIQTLLEEPGSNLALAGFFAFAVGGALTDYFVAAWAGLLGGLGGLLLIWRGARTRGVLTIALSVLAMIPTVLWIRYSLPTLAADGDVSRVTGFSAFRSGLVNGVLQGVRALMKTLASNVALTAGAIMGAGALYRARKDIDLLLAATTAVFILLALALNSLWAPILKERTFIVLAPPFALLAVRALLAAPSGVWMRRIVLLIPIAAALTPFLFISEYTKDREKLGEVRKAVAHAGACAGQPVLTLYPKSPHPDFAISFTADALAGSAKPGTGSVKLIDAASWRGAQPASTCRIKALVLGLTRGEKADHQAARDALRAAGVPIDTLKEVKLGGGRQRLFETP